MITLSVVSFILYLAASFSFGVAANNAVRLLWRK